MTERDEQVRKLAHDLGEVSPWPGTERLAERAIAAGWCQFGPTLRAALDRLPRGVAGRTVVPLSGREEWHLPINGADALFTALTGAAEGPTYPCDKCGVRMTKAQGGTTFTVCEKCWDDDSAQPPAPPAAAPGAPDTRWVVQRRVDGAFYWPDSPRRALFVSVITDHTVFVEETNALRAAMNCCCQFSEPCTVRRVTRAPGKRRWEECEEFNRGEPHLYVGAILVRELPTEPGPWQLAPLAQPEGTP